MRYGFVLDQDACIGCHACTVACKAENDVPLGAFRTWVKWVEHGAFPDTQRSAAVLRCNHCADAPCIDICPTGALFRRDNGIVDLDQSRCIGCASCLQACPYDAIYIDDRHGTAAKCHFCAHRLEVGLAPACVAVCPEQAIKVIDADDPATRRELGERAALVRKPERATQPRTYYLGADLATLDPLAVDGSRTLSHSEVPDPMPAPGTLAARAVYDVPRARQWGPKIAWYLVTKAIAAGALLAAAVSPWIPGLDATILGAVSLLFVSITAVLLILDLHKPGRFWYLLAKPNIGSWLVKGGWILMGHGALSVVWVVVAGLWGSGGGAWGFGEGLRVAGGGALSLWERVGVRAGPATLLLLLAAASIVVALLTSVYTAFLFRQARGRELWCEDVTLPWVLSVQAATAMVAFLWLFGAAGPVWVLAYAAAMVWATLWPPRTLQAKRAHHLMVRHPAFAGGFAAALGAALFPPLLALSFLLFDWIYVKAGQEVPLS
ncbi:MAG TPA: 4Fe-4S dicluster domain-containing protein [Thermoanaerobaculia bacterium]|nr:4Fe-4S dicluster domain-containing protein [Thermoanaerobaculia bacterium]